MKKKNVNTNLVLTIMVLAGLLGYTLLVQAGNLEPSAPPGPTMKTLDEVYEAASAGISARRGYIKFLSIGSPATVELFTVGQGERFVLLKVMARKNNDQWVVKINDETILNAQGATCEATTFSSYIFQFMWDFPDRTVVLGPNDVLKVYTPDSHVHPLNFHIIGYFYDI